MDTTTIKSPLDDFSKGTLSPEISEPLIRAVHEAGHAAVATHLGIGFQYVSIVPAGHRLGSIDIPPYVVSEVCALENFVKTLLAGMAAHACFMPTLGSNFIDTSGGDDYQNVHTFLQKVPPDDQRKIWGDMS